MRRANTLSRYITELASLLISVAGQRYQYSDILKFRSRIARWFAERPEKRKPRREVTANSRRISLISYRDVARRSWTNRRARASSGGSSGFPSSLLLHSRVASIDSHGCHPHFLARHVHVTSLAGDRGLETTPVVFVKTPLFASRSLTAARPRSSRVRSSSPRYLRVTRDTSSSSLARWKPASPRRRAERNAASRRGSAARSASAARAFLSLERPRGSPDTWRDASTSAVLPTAQASRDWGLHNKRTRERCAGASMSRAPPLPFSSSVALGFCSPSIPLSSSFAISLSPPPPLTLSLCFSLSLHPLIDN